MRVLFFNRWVGVHGGGTETHLLELARRFSQRGHKVSILTREGKRLKDLDEAIRVIRISKNFRESEHSYEDFRVYIHTAFFAWKSLIRLFLLYFRGQRYDLISVHFATEAIVAMIFRFFTGTRFLFVLEGYTPWEAKAASFADKCIAISHFEANKYREKHNLNSKVIYIGIDNKRFAAGRDAGKLLRKKLVSENEILVLTVCRLEPRKDIFTLLAAAEEAHSKNRALKFVIVGEGISREIIQKEILRKQISSFVLLTGFVSDEELPSYYNSADIFLLTSREEWFGIVFLEAMAAGCPIIATNVDACPEVINGAGEFFEKGEALSLAEKLLKFAADPLLRDRLGSAARDRARGFDWERQIAAYEGEFLSVIRKKNV